MAFPTAVMYQTFVCPAVRRISLSASTRLRELIREQIHETVIAEPVILSSYWYLPYWYVLTIFEELRRFCPEVVVELLGGKKLLLCSVLPEDDFLHTQEVMTVPELIVEPDISPEIRTPELQFDLSEVPPAQDKNFLDTVLYVKQRVTYVKNLKFTGATDPFTALLSYVIWLKYAQSIRYIEEEQFLELV